MLQNEQRRPSRSFQQEETVAFKIGRATGEAARSRHTKARRKGLGSLRKSRLFHFVVANEWIGFSDTERLAGAPCRRARAASQITCTALCSQSRTLGCTGLTRFCLAKATSYRNQRSHSVPG